MNNRLFRDIAVLIARTVLGVIFIAHGWQMYAGMGVETMISNFGQAGIPLPALAVWFALIVQIIGGAMLIAGLAVQVLGILLCLNMLGAVWFVHLENGLLVSDDGYEFVLTLAVLSLLLSAIGAGAFSLDRFIVPRLTALRPSAERVPG
ncbi:MULTISPECIES: DoxX family protein [Catenuloplanes]|uniref:Oxidoreductase n=1 Tax=Catenuloplanes niger TaxID=587534 RepID=A0AAE4CYJ6_9ACTN|nr:DoxX family protein [Catenuloplanes niger]MDR7325934.1 putative oxidoreductase [Catenuloplanes niger]